MRYILLNSMLSKRFRLPVERGALVLREGVKGRPAIIADSAADKAGMKEADVIIEVNNTVIDEKTSIEDVLEKVSLGQELPVKILRQGQEKMLTLVAEERE